MLAHETSSRRPKEAAPAAREGSNSLTTIGQAGAPAAWSFPSCHTTEPHNRRRNEARSSKLEARNSAIVRLPAPTRARSAGRNRPPAHHATRPRSLPSHEDTIRALLPWRRAKRCLSIGPCAKRWDRAAWFLKSIHRAIEGKRHLGKESVNGQHATHRTRSNEPIHAQAMHHEPGKTTAARAKATVQQTPPRAGIGHGRAGAGGRRFVRPEHGSRGADVSAVIAEVRRRGCRRATGRTGGPPPRHRARGRARRRRVRQPEGAAAMTAAGARASSRRDVRARGQDTHAVDCGAPISGGSIDVAHQ